MYKLCKTEQSAARQREVEMGLLELMMIQRYEDISVSDLCARVGIPRKSFYRYFSSKDGAFHALLDHTMMEYEGFSGPYAIGEKRTLERDLERFFMFWLMKKPLLDVLAKSNLTGVLIERAISNSISENTLARRFLPLDQKPVQEQIITFCICGLMSMVMQWHNGGYAHSARFMAQTAVRLVTMPMFPDIESLL